ncbi:hypothetical protein [Terribacillus saccharophilus]|uniref:hypothetical protein n=1 Tax=Terribacillus saccharophilus TaxID=361277 RepID=UPI0013DD058A|nr:hypothetical protein [Terribacillus goriensis]
MNNALFLLQNNQYWERAIRYVLQFSFYAEWLFLDDADNMHGFYFVYMVSLANNSSG